jgi:CRP/FNR family transcriptional regulator
MLPLRLYRRDCSEVDGVSPCDSCKARALSVCASLEGEGVRRLAQASRVVHAAPGAALVSQGEAAEEVINLTDGSARVVRQLEDGRRQIVGFVFAGDVLGTTAGETHAYSVEALEPVTACRFRKTQYRALSRQFPELETALLDRLGDELRDTQAQLVTLGRRTATERVAAFLLELDARRGPRSDGRLDLPMSRADMADYLGLTIETVSRAMTELKASGALRLESPRRLRLADRPALATLAGAD